MYRFLSLFGLVILVAMVACNKGKEDVTTRKLDNNETSALIMDGIRPQLTGTWHMKEVAISPFAPGTNEVGIYKDTVLKDFANLEITLIKYETPFDKLYNDVSGSLNYKNKRYEVGFRLLAYNRYLPKKVGPQASALFEFRSVIVGTRPTEPEELNLQHLGLIGENYNIEISADGKTMTWKGQSRSVKNILFTKR
ncbi:hypothetical protein [Mucilaginibacter sp. PAMB04168]|uniref:hypothetical protein n=1 Tax=Mucilaginibacter sp. PAMB04168 TaxID=3138567 RepID=UPI0031F6A599